MERFGTGLPHIGVLGRPLSTIFQAVLLSIFDAAAGQADAAIRAILMQGSN